jgi:hypothetical protein
VNCPAARCSTLTLVVPEACRRELLHPDARLLELLRPRCVSHRAASSSMRAPRAASSPTRATPLAGPRPSFCRWERQRTMCIEKGCFAPTDGVATVPDFLGTSLLSSAPGPQWLLGASGRAAACRSVCKAFRTPKYCYKVLNGVRLAPLTFLQPNIKSEPLHSCFKTRSRAIPF